jgi:hypothetical protein
MNPNRPSPGVDRRALLSAVAVLPALSAPKLGMGGGQIGLFEGFMRERPPSNSRSATD